VLKLLWISFCVFIFPTAALSEALPSDPTQPDSWQQTISVGGEEDRATQFEVSSVLSGSHRQSAVVNGRRVKVGDTVGGAEVLQISTTGVSLQVDDEQRFISVSDNTQLKRIRSE